MQRPKLLLPVTDDGVSETGTAVGAAAGTAVSVDGAVDPVVVVVVGAGEDDCLSFLEILLSMDLPLPLPLGDDSFSFFFLFADDDAPFVLGSFVPFMKGGMVASPISPSVDEL